MKVTEQFIYSGRYACRLENGRYMLSNGTMEMLLCEKVEEGFKVIRSGIVGGIMMRTMEDFIWCVENWKENIQ